MIKNIRYKWFSDYNCFEYKKCEVENKILYTTVLVTTSFLNTKISGVENKTPNHDKWITTPEFNKLPAEKFPARLKQGNLIGKSDFDNKLTRFTRKITSNKRQYLEVQKKLNSRITNDYNFS